MTEQQKQVRTVVIGLLLGMLLSALDQTIISTAMPTVIRELGGFALYSWVFSIYMLTSTTAVPLFGKLADLYGRRLVYMIGMSIFIAGSALCGIAHNMTELIVFRGIQGIGAGALMPVTMTIIGDIFPPERRGKMQGIFGAVFGLSSVIGPAIGGFIVEHSSWEWVFYVNLPFGIASMIIIGLSLKESKGLGKRSVDWFGAITLSLSIVSLLLALVMGGNGNETSGTHYSWGSPQIIGLFAASALFLALFLIIERKAPEPIIPLPLFKNRVIAVSSITGFFMGAGMFGAITYIPLFVQGVVGESPSRAGYVLTPLMISLILTSIVGGRIITKVTYRSIVVTGMTIMGIGFLLMSQMDVHTSNATVILYMIITGLGMGPLMPTFTIAVQSSVPQEVRGVATSSSQFFRSIGGTIGVSVMGALMANRMSSGLSDLGNKLTQIPAETLQKYSNPQLLLTPEAKEKVPPQVFAGLQQVLADSIDAVFTAGVILILIGIVAGFFLGKARLDRTKGARNADSQKEETLSPNADMV